ncbi:MAG: hypothetical protein JNL10_18675 [Verrucomicrobiales bacterium]|nr:hypothetical protein [Verrucomicrobiales bacterium]
MKDPNHPGSSDPWAFTSRVGRASKGILPRAPLLAATFALALLPWRSLSADCPPQEGPISFPGRIASGCDHVGPVLRFEYQPLEGRDFGLMTGDTWSQISFEPSAFIGLVGPGKTGSAISFPYSSLNLLEDRKQALIIQHVPDLKKSEFVVGRVSIGQTIEATTPGIVVSADSPYEFQTMDLADGTTVLLREQTKGIDMIALSSSGEPLWSILVDPATLLQASGMEDLDESFLGNESRDGSHLYLFTHGSMRITNGTGEGTRRSVALVLCFDRSGSLRWSRRLGIPELDADWIVSDDAAAHGEGLLLLIAGERSGEARSLLLSIDPDGNLSWSRSLNHPFESVRSTSPGRVMLSDERGTEAEPHSLFAVFDAVDGFLQQARFSESVSLEGDLDDLGQLIFSTEEGRVIGSSTADLRSFQWKRYLGPPSLEVDVDADRRTLTYISQPVGSNGDPTEWLQSGLDVVVLDNNLEAGASCSLFQDVPGPNAAGPLTLSSESTLVEWETIAWNLTATPFAPRRAPLTMETLPLKGTALCTLLDPRPRFDATLASNGRLKVSFVTTPGLVHSLRAANSLLENFLEIRRGMGTGDRVSIELDAPASSQFFKLIESPAP